MNPFNTLLDDLASRVTAIYLAAITAALLAYFRSEASAGIPTLAGMNERCWRCSAEMAFVHGTWQCPVCKLKLGCCEGEPQTACDAPEPKSLDVVDAKR